MRMLENKMIRTISGYETENVVGGRRKLHNMELQNSYSSPNIRRMWEAGKTRRAYKIVVRKPEGKLPLGRPTYRREDNTKMNLKEMRCEDVNLFHFAQDRV
jgi:hypothetical protein